MRARDSCTRADDDITPSREPRRHIVFSRAVAVVIIIYLTYIILLIYRLLVIIFVVCVRETRRRDVPIRRRLPHCARIIRRRRGRPRVPAGAYISRDSAAEWGKTEEKIQNKIKDTTSNIRQRYL